MVRRKVILILGILVIAGLTLDNSIDRFGGSVRYSNDGKIE